MNLVSSREISVVIQGPLHRNSSEYGVETTVSSIQKWLPDAEIIVSTWVGENVAGLKYHKLVVSEPPEKLLDKTGYPNYLGHQRLSTLSGLNVCTRPYVLKLRADHSLSSNSFCVELDKVNKNKEFAIFDSKIVVSSFFLRNPLKVPFLFHISDLVQFGRKNDLITFWSFPPPTLSELLQKRPKGRIGLFGNYSGTTLFKEVPEQTIIIRLLQRLGVDVNLPYPCATRYDWFYIWEHLLAENFHVIDADKPIIVFPKRFHKAFLGKKTVLSEADMIELLRSIQFFSREKNCIERSRYD